MKIVVPIKRVIDHNVRVRPTADGTGVDSASVKMAINPFCEIALEEAVRLKERGLASEVLVVTIGTAAAQEQLRGALAVGADRALLIETERALEPLAVARTLARIVEEERPGLALLGKQAIDSDDNQVGQMLAALLGWPQATFASALELEGEKARVTREVDGGMVTLELALPAVVTADLRLNEPRYARLPDIMKAKKKPIERRALEEMALDLPAQTEVLAVETPTPRQRGVILDSVDALIDKLRNVEKVIP